MCDCITNLNIQLAERGAKLVRSFVVRPSLHDVVTICVERTEPRQGMAPKTPRPRYCPFCGEKYLSADLPEPGSGFAPGPAERPVA